jgi:hypothetical protein
MIRVERGFRLGRFEGSCDVGLLVQSGLGTSEEERENQMKERESSWRRLHSGEIENGGEKVCLMEERENKI